MILQLGEVIWIIIGSIFCLATVYYIFELLPAYIRYRKHYFNPHVPSDEDILSLLETTDQEFPLIQFQITTKGNEVGVVKRGIDSIINLTQSQLFEENIELLVVTDDPSEVSIFSKYFEEYKIPFPAKVLFVPENYETTNSTMFKARSLHYSIEYRQNNGSKKKRNQKSYIFYFDAESTISERNFRRVIHSIITQDKDVFGGPIIYPHNYFRANIFSRQMEASRPFNCYHCIQILKNPPPTHLHGSNLVVEEDIAKRIGWDFGRIKNQPLLAEDLIFGFKVYSKYGSEAFGWHGGGLYEQPPLSIRSSINARLRWVTGTWQSISFLETNPDFKTLPWRTKAWISFRIRSRIIAHSLSFFAALFFIISLLFIFFPPLYSLFWINPEIASPALRAIQVFLYRYAFFPITILWMFTILNGTSKNLEKIDNLSRKDKLLEYLKILIVTPIAGAIDSLIALYATIRWFLGKPYISWVVTKK